MPLDPTKLSSLRRKVLAKGQELADMLSALLAGQKPDGLDLLTAEPGETEEEKLRRYLKLIQDRLDAMEAGSYGRCARCGEDIPLVELEEMPWADECHKHAAA